MMLASAGRKLENWAEVVGLAEAHRVEGLVAHALRSAPMQVPTDVMRWSAEVRRTFRSRASVEIAESLRVSRALKTAAIPFRVLKGAPLGALAYGEPGLKRSWDIDVLVHPKDAVRAAECIVGLDFVPTKPPRVLDAAEFRRWSAVSKHAEYDSSRGVAVELHWRVSNLPYLLEDIDAGTPARIVPLLGGHGVPTLADAPQLAYLCVHGCAHGWSRLKWFADFSGFVSNQPAAELDRLIVEAEKLGTGDAIAASFLLREQLLGYEAPSGVRSTARATELADLSLRVIRARCASREIEQDREARRATERICASIAPGLRYRAEYLRRRHRGSEIRLLVALPRGLEWAYWIIRPYSYLRRAAARLGR